MTQQKSKNKTLTRKLPTELGLRVQIRRLRRTMALLTKKNADGWISPDRRYVDTIYAARYIGKSVSRLRNMKSEGVGPVCCSKSGRVYYLLSDLQEFIETGKSLRNVHVATSG